MKKPPRAIVSLALAVIYLLITLSPLAPLVLHSPHVAHAITGECVGECDICGCSPEMRASHTCCCWLKKKEQHHHDDDQEQAADHCEKEHHGAKPVFTCGCPCGNDKTIGLWGANKIEQLPYRFAEGKPPLQESLLGSLNPSRLTSHYGDPPDPPPKVMFLAC
jgi:hypothetical protein